MLSISQIAGTKTLVHRKNLARTDRRELWNEAAKSVRDSKSPDIGKELIGSHVSIDDVRATVQDKLEECIQKRWTYTRSNGREIVFWDVLDKVMQWVNKFKAVGDVAVQYDPGHVALPWAAIRFVLQASVSSVETFGHMLEGVELASRIIAIYAEVERTCLKGISRLKTQLTNALVKMYAAVLAFLLRARRYFGQSSSKRALKGAFQSYQTTVAPWVDRIQNTETDVCRLVDLVQSEGSSSEAIQTLLLAI